MTGGEVYKAAGVDYGVLDGTKRGAQDAAASTADNAAPMGIREISASRGESAFVWKDQRTGRLRASVIEGLGTKALVADAVRPISGHSHYDDIAQDTVAMIANDLITVGAMPETIMAYWSVDSADWFEDRERAEDLIEGWRKACAQATVIWGGGETPALKDMHIPGTIELAGAMTGSFMDDRHLTLGKNLRGNEDIIMLASSGLHANGITLARKVAQDAPDGYCSILADGRSYGEALLTPTPIYVSAVRELLRSNVLIRYMANITGHGLRKLMRAPQDTLAYRLHTLPKPQAEFGFMQEQLGCSDEEMYSTFNMGSGFALMVDPRHTAAALDILQSESWNAQLVGSVEPGTKQVILPNGVTFAADSLNIR